MKTRMAATTANQQCWMTTTKTKGKVTRAKANSNEGRWGDRSLSSSSMLMEKKGWTWERTGWTGMAIVGKARTPARVLEASGDAGGGNANGEGSVIKDGGESLALWGGK